MLRTLKDVEGFHVAATDGDIGKVRDFYFDDQRWAIRYLIVDTRGFWQAPHRVLISPIAFRQVDWSTRQFHLALDRYKVKDSPPADLDRPVSLQYERAYHQYYGWAPYWGFGGGWDWGIDTYPSALANRAWPDEQALQDPNADHHLRSVQEVTGYHVNGGRADDDVLGQVIDFIVDDQTWAIRYLVIDTNKWWFGKKVLVAPRWAHEISWRERTIYTDISREMIKESPEWSAAGAVNRQYEARLYDYYGRPAYWLDTDRQKEDAPIARLPDDSHAVH